MIEQTSDDLFYSATHIFFIIIHRLSLAIFEQKYHEFNLPKSTEILENHV